MNKKSSRECATTQFSATPSEKSPAMALVLLAGSPRIRRCHLRGDVVNVCRSLIFCSLPRGRYKGLRREDDRAAKTWVTRAVSGRCRMAGASQDQSRVNSTALALAGFRAPDGGGNVMGWYSGG